MLNTKGLTDMTYIKDVAKGNVDFINQMVDIFLLKTPEGLDELEKMISVQNWEMASFHAHKLKATYAYMGITTLKDILLDIERNSKSREGLESIPAKFETLKEQTVLAVKELEEYKTNNQKL
jgi:HPt (histidine-containing phosphotransfer) domain-containing protein